VVLYPIRRLMRARKRPVETQPAAAGDSSKS
jgi:hypothetical protein